ncbi:DUF3288 family protein [Gloeocapsa sp. PCC 73106]|uniref:DUF3288 family protein n=1 Tax=Gloeocapsa sp. PCC 73106 TaxID=102232 RepID=UPI0002ACE205|nr:DUF3288 family protein [Gloeocapsa sp. PCC 73106]ELR96769.1 Protein of unknown function (DUF3288) [Gloeocapsa sp. PCC 73106]
MTEQQHPQEYSDRQILTQILQQEATPDNLADVARFLIRYHNFPGARGIQADLAQILQQWGLDQETLFAKTRKLYSDKKISYQKLSPEQTQDWS